jgi:hypothetical protein
MPASPVARSPSPQKLGGSALSSLLGLGVGGKAREARRAVGGGENRSEDEDITVYPMGQTRLHRLSRSAADATKIPSAWRCCLPRLKVADGRDDGRKGGWSCGSEAGRVTTTCAEVFVECCMRRRICMHGRLDVLRLINWPLLYRAAPNGP